MVLAALALVLVILLPLIVLILVIIKVVRAGEQSSVLLLSSTPMRAITCPTR